MRSSKKYQDLDGTTSRYLVEYEVDSEQHARVYVYIYKSDCSVTGVCDTVDENGIYYREVDTPQTEDLQTVNKWDLIDGTIAFYKDYIPPAGSSIVIEVATTPEEFGDVLGQASYEKAELERIAAELAATNAALSETNAALSELAASTSEVNTGDSEAAALLSANNAAISETNAGLSETASALSAANSLASETASALSAAAALVSEGNASTSETNAALSAAAALLSETNAAASAAAALLSENNTQGIYDDTVTLVNSIGLDNLTDVDVTTVLPQEGDTLLYDNTTQEYKPGAGVDLSSVDKDIIPDTDNTKDLGTITKNWKEVHATQVTSEITQTSTINSTTINNTNDINTETVTLNNSATILSGLNTPEGNVIGDAGDMYIRQKSDGFIPETEIDYTNQDNLYKKGGIILFNDTVMPGLYDASSLGGTGVMGSGNYLFVANNYVDATTGFKSIEVIDVSDPKNPIKVNSIYVTGVTTNTMNRIIIRGNWLILYTSGANIGKMYKVDITNPLTASSVDTLEIHSTETLNGNWMKEQDDTMFLYQGSDIFKIFDLNTVISNNGVPIFTEYDINIITGESSSIQYIFINPVDPTKIFLIGSRASFGDYIAMYDINNISLAGKLWEESIINDNTTSHVYLNNGIVILRTGLTTSTSLNLLGVLPVYNKADIEYSRNGQSTADQFSVVSGNKLIEWDGRIYIKDITTRYYTNSIQDTYFIPLGSVTVEVNTYIDKVNNNIYFFFDASAYLRCVVMTGFEDEPSANQPIKNELIYIKTGTNGSNTGWINIA